MTVAAFSSLIRFSPSASTATTNEATTEVTTDTVFQITDTTKRVIDPNTAVVVQVDADGGGGGSYATVAADLYAIDYLFGKITFSPALAAAATVRISYSYFALVNAIEAREFSISMVRAIHESTVFDTAGGYKTRAVGLMDASGELGMLSMHNQDHDTGAGSFKFNDLWAAGTKFLLEITFGTVTTEKFRGWVFLESLEDKATPNELADARVKWVAAPFPGTGQTEQALFGFGL